MARSNHQTRHSRSLGGSQPVIGRYLLVQADQLDLQPRPRPVAGPIAVSGSLSRPGGQTRLLGHGVTGYDEEL
jgi:hypothetical protein